MIRPEMIRTIWQICAWIIYIAMAVIPFMKSLSAYQQNHYKVDRYSHWLWKQFCYEMHSVFYYLLLAIPYVIMEYSHKTMAFVLFIGFSIFYIMCRYGRCDWKKLKDSVKWTARMVRTAVSLVFLHFLWMFVWIYHLSVVSYGWGCLLAFVSSWMGIFVVWFLLYPLEHVIAWLYKKEAAMYMRDMPGMKIAITGSYGKTSCKYFLDAILSTEYYGLMTPKSYNTVMGITQTIRKQWKPLHQYFICEMGSDHPGEIKEMMDVVCPKYGVVTTIGPQHLQTFGTMRNIIEEKMSLVENLPEDGIAFLNKDNRYIAEYVFHNSCQKIWFSLQQEADYQVVSIFQSSEGTRFTVLVQGNYYDFETQLLGKHNVLNVVAMIAVAHTLGMSMEKMQRVVKRICCVEHRFERKMWHGRLLIDNSYSSNAESMLEALQILSQMPNKRVLVTPGLVDLAQLQDTTNRMFGRLMKDKVDVVILVGEQQTQAIYDGLQTSGFCQEDVYVVANMREALQKALAITNEKDVVLIENDLPDVFYSKVDLQKGGK